MERVHRALTKLAFQNLLHPFQPFIIGQKIIGPLIALKFNIPLIFAEKIKQNMVMLLRKTTNQKWMKVFFQLQI